MRGSPRAGDLMPSGGRSAGAGCETTARAALSRIRRHREFRCVPSTAGCSCRDPGEHLLQLLYSPFRCVLQENTAARPRADGARLVQRQEIEELEHITGRLGEKDLLTRRE